jgi:hypothetical protein
MTVSPEEIRTINRRKKLSKIWASPEWKEKKAEFIKGKVCSWCGTTEKLLPHHPYIKSLSDGTYLNLYLSGCVVLCTKCHYALHHGRKLCPKCKKGYCPFDTEMCYDCYKKEHPEIEELKHKKKEEIKALRKKLNKQAREKYKR